MEEFKKRVRVIMLPTDKAENAILKFHNGGGLAYYPEEFFTKSYLGELMAKAYHLYFISDEEIKIGDYYYDPIVRKILKCENKEEEALIKASKHLQQKKIIATTDPNFDRKNGNVLMWKIFPKPPKAFIEEYCKLGGIDEVDVECYSENLIDECSGDILEKGYIKVDPNHNTITIHSIKDSWNREEVEEIIRNVVPEVGGGMGYRQEDLDEWIKENLQ